MSRDKIINRDVNPLLMSLPERFTSFLPHQIPAVMQIMEAYENGAEVVVLDAPTGSGKTLIGETVRRLLRTSALYVCSSKSLQAQFVRDFPYSRVLKGRANYPTERYPEQFTGEFGGLSAEDCTWTLDNKCKLCVGKMSCPYEVAKNLALGADLAVLNTAYFLTEANGPGKFGAQQFVVMDEADQLEGALMGHVSVEIGERRLERWKWDVPEKVTVKESYREWLEDKVVRLGEIAGRIPRGDKPQHVRERKYVSGLRGKMKAVLLGLDSDAWVYTGRSRSDRPGKGVAFKPARVDHLGEEMLWKHSRKWLLMSATVISASEMLDSLGWEGKYEVVRVANTFPVENRRVIVRTIAPMNNKAKEQNRPRMMQAINETLEDHNTERVLIHSVSYDLTQYIVNNYQPLTSASENREVFSYTSSRDRDAVLDKFRSTPAAVLVAPSFERGIDLVGDDCRVQIIAKVPFPYLGDRQVSTRLHSRGGQTWYTVQAIRDIVQMYGRAVRNVDDYAVCYIFDSDFKTKLWNSGRGMFPRWFVEAIKWQ